MAPRKYDPAEPERTTDQTSSRGTTAGREPRGADEGAAEKVTGTRDAATADRATSGSEDAREPGRGTGTRQGVRGPRGRGRDAETVASDTATDRSGTRVGTDRDREGARDRVSAGETRGDHVGGTRRESAGGTGREAADETRRETTDKTRRETAGTSTGRTATASGTAGAATTSSKDSTLDTAAEERRRDRIALELQRSKNRRLTDFGLLILRLSLLLLALHGLYKIQHFDAVRQMVGATPIGSAAPDVMAVLQILAETALPLLLVLGLFTRIAGVLLAADMGLVWVLMHLSKPPLIVDQGALTGENAMLFGLIGLTLVFTGAGRFAFDHAFGHKGARRRAERRAEKLA